MSSISSNPTTVPTPTSNQSYELLIGSEDWYARAQGLTEQLFDEVQDIATEYGREITTESDIGDPQRFIVDYAEEEDITHIVLGAHGRSEKERPLFGSVAETVARRASVPITIIR